MEMPSLRHFSLSPLPAVSASSSLDCGLRFHCGPQGQQAPFYTQPCAYLGERTLSTPTESRTTSEFQEIATSAIEWNHPDPLQRLHETLVPQPSQMQVSFLSPHRATSEIAETPIENAELELFVDGSAQVIEGSTAQKTILPPESIIDLYKDVPLYEAWTWLDKGATVDSSGCWTKGGKWGLPDCIDSDQGTHFTGQMPGVIDLRNADVHIASDALIAYCENLTKAVQSARERVESCWQTPLEGGHTIIPGQWVMIKSFRNKPLEPKWYGPHQVMLITAAAVLCQEGKLGLMCHTIPLDGCPETHTRRTPHLQNATLWGKTSQSSTYINGPELALDGLLNTFSHTNSETDPWWRVDLLKVYRVNRVTITNRPGHANRISGAVIRIGNFPDIYSNTICSVISTLGEGATATFSCSGMEGRYMIVHIPGDEKILSLSEVGVYGYLAGNVAVDGATTQSSTFTGWFAEKAIDSNRGLQQNTACSSTLNEINPWWRLDLRNVYEISEVVVTNRNDCCAEQINGAEIRIGNTLENNGNNNPICAVIRAIPAGESYRYSCGGMEGRYVNLIIPGDMKTLTLCEVEVYREVPVLKRSFVKMQFNSRVDLTDPSVREHVLKKLGSALADGGLTNVTLRWSQTPKRVIQKVNASKSHCGNGK
ncbi:uncharacterized protein LOC131543897 [Onychostoma macrolepis]|uniref:uncharacterized protein LOC131543897 n=1 Tax=Onychostoma macrolepis TaxID=369639 RepID=UPI002729ED66|nr:uncharacterized protein LOC131543897 [Onychostoma macrolepis]